MKRRLPKLSLSNYARIHGRFYDRWGARSFREEANVPLIFKPKYDKIVELLLYLAHRYPGADKYQAVKFFYLADREHITQYGRPITFETYYAMSYGPVASNALNLLNNDPATFRQAGIKNLPFETEVGKTKTGHDTTFLRAPLREVNLELFSKSDLRVFDAIVSKYRNASFNELYNLTHEHPAYVAAWTKRRHPDAARSEMYYDEMIEDDEKRAALVEDISPVSTNM
jgi:uncharacterized phage-associated protein